jgi:TolC family type I secretion outer membrane protein
MRATREQYPSIAVVLVVMMIGLLTIPVFAQTTPPPATPAPETQPVPTIPASVLPELPQLTVPNLPAGQSQVPDHPMSLQEAIDLALKLQPQMGISAGAVEAARGRVSQARSQALPTASISADGSKSGPATTARTATGDPNHPFTTTTLSTTSYSTSISGRQLVYDFGRTPATISQARNQERSAQHSFHRTSQEVINQVKQSYYTLLQNQRLVAVQLRNVADQQSHLDLARARFDAGVAPRSDVVTAQTSVADAIFNLATAQNNAATARVQLNLAMGVDARNATQVEETTESEITIPADQLVKLALDSRPDVKQIRADLAAARDVLKIAKTNNLPSIAATANYNYTGTSFPPDRRSWTYTLGFSWPFLDFGETRGGIRAAEGSLHSTEAQLQQVEQNVSSDVVQAYLNVQTAAQKVTSTTAEVANAQENVRLQTGRYQAGVATYIELLDAETALVTAQTNQVNAQYGLSEARAQLELALGMTLPTTATPKPATQ